MLLLAHFALFTTACKKQEPSPLHDAFAQNATTETISLNTNCIPNVSQGHYVFTSETCFEEYTKSLRGQNLDSVEATSGIASFRRYSNGPDEDNPIIEDLRFASVLNADGIVEVNGYIFRIHLPDSTIYIVRSGNPNDLAALVAATKVSELPTGALHYSFHTDVFAILFDPPRGIFCGDDFAEKDVDEDIHNPYCTGGPNNASFRHKLKIFYRPWGIWFNLDLKFRHRCKSNCNNGTVGGLSNGTDFDMKWSAFWTPRCRSSASSTRVYVTCVGGGCDPFPEAGPNFDHEFYCSTRALTSYNVDATAELLNACDGIQVFETQSLHIESN